MHMADALLTPAVAGVMYAASAVVAGASIVELHKEEKQDLTSAAKKLPTMAVMSALVFAGQMINYTIPGTGSSGHLCGGLLLTSVLGPWAGFLSMIVILTIQSLFFADGGLMALGANVWNMAFYGCFVGYFLIYRPLMHSRCFARRGERAANRLKITLASVLGCVLTLQLGAFSVVLETTLSGITDLPFGAFCAIMQPIHLAIGLIEGLITAAVLLFLYEARPELLRDVRTGGETAGKVSFKGTIAVIAIAAVLVGGGWLVVRHMQAAAACRCWPAAIPTGWSGRCSATVTPATRRTWASTRTATACRAARPIRPVPCRKRRRSCRTIPSPGAIPQLARPCPASRALPSWRRQRRSSAVSAGSAGTRSAINPNLDTRHPDTTHAASSIRSLPQWAFLHQWGR